VSAAVPDVASAKTRLRDAAVVAGYELGEALRSRRVVILVLLFVGGAVAGTLAFVEVLESLEASLAQALAVADPGKPGAVTAALMKSPEFLRMLSRLVRDQALARELVGLPPLALFYGWLGLTFMPVLIMLTSAETVSAELATGSARFSLLRTDRLSFSLGKLAGQSLLMAVGVALGALAVWITGYFSLASFDAGRSALWLALLSLRISVYAFAYVGLAVGLSHLTRSVPLSRALAIGSLIALGALWGIGSYNDWVREHAAAAADTLLTLVPRSHMLPLWQPDVLDRAPALVMLGALGVVYFALGYAYRARRDA
jgi:ABC-type transport system involved in multi-copper enzyme maturation permease subunit